MTTKQRSLLRGIAAKQNALFQLGKGDITDNIIVAINNAFNTRELVKLGVLKTCSMDIVELANLLAARTSSELVCIIGSKVVLYKLSTSDSIVHLIK